MNKIEIECKAGDRGFFTVGSDSYPCTVVKATKTRITVREVQFKIVRGSEQSDNAEYEFSDNGKGALRTFTLREGGAWRMVRCKYGSLRLGEWHARQDPCF